MTDIVFEGTAGVTEAGAGAVNGRLGTAHDGDRVAAGGRDPASGAWTVSRSKDRAGDDKAVHSGESVTLSDPGHKVDGRPAVSVADAQANEGANATVDFEVSPSRAFTGTGHRVTVDYARAEGTAKAGEDYTATSGTLTFGPGESSKTVSVPVLDDAIDEGEETFVLRLCNATGARSGDGEATGTIKTVSRRIGNSVGPDRARGGIAERAIRCGGGRAQRGRPGIGLAGLAMFAAAFSALVSLAFADTARAQVTTPGAPASFAAEGGDALVRLTWSAPSSDGGAPVTKYQYRYSAGTAVAAGAAWIDVPDVDESGDPADDTVYRVTGLANSTGYAFELRAVNSEGGGTPASDYATPMAQACAEPDLGTRRSVWSGTVTVGYVIVSGSPNYGYLADDPPYGSLSENQFSIGANTYTIDGIYAEVAPTAGQLTFDAGGSLTAEEKAALKLHVCGDADGLEFSTATEVTAQFFGFLTGEYQWPTAGLDWSLSQTRKLRLSLPANNPPQGRPAISGSAAVAQPLTASTDAITDADGLGTFTYQWIRVDADGASNPVNVGTNAATYTLTAADVGKRLKVEVSFTDKLGASEKVTSDPYPETGTVMPVAVADVTVTSTPAWSADTYGAREHLEFSVRFTAPMTVTGHPTFAFTLGSATRQATYFAGSGTDTLLFSYAVQGGADPDVDADGVSWAANSLSLGGGAIVSVTGSVTPRLTHAAQSALPGQKVEGSNAVTAATITSVAVTSMPPLTSPGATTPDTYGIGDTIAITVTVSAAVTVAGDPEFAFSLNDAGAPDRRVRAAYNAAASIAATLVFHYTVQLGDSDDDGISIGDVATAFVLDANDRVRTAAQKVDVDLSFTAPGIQAGHRVDGAQSVSCPAPDLSQRRQIWTGRMTVGESEQSRGGEITGFPLQTVRGFEPGYGSLVNRTFGLAGRRYTVEAINYGTQSRFLHFYNKVDVDESLKYGDLSGVFTTEAKKALTLHVCNRFFAFNDADVGGLNSGLFAIDFGGILTFPYVWRPVNPALNWPNGSTIFLRLSLTANKDATGAPTMSGTTQPGQTLTADVSGIADEDGLPDASEFNYQWLWVNQDGSSNPTDIPDATSATYDLTHDDLGRKLKVRVSFTDKLGAEETLLSEASSTVIDPSDVTPPRLVSATLQDTTVTLLYDEPLDETSVPGTAAYALTGTITVTGVSVEYRTVRLTLSAAPGDNTTAALSYTVPTGDDAMPVQDVAGNDAAAFSGQTLVAPLRLVKDGMVHDSEGRLEILYNSRWGTVCDDYWTRINEDVVCRILGHPRGSADAELRARDFPPLAAGKDIWLDDVTCAGNETNLLDCPRRANRAVGTHNCRADHSEDVAMRCLTGTVPYVTAIKVSDAPYAAGGTLQVTLVWSEAVEVTTPSGGEVPKVWVGYGATVEFGGGSSELEPEAELALYASGSGTNQTVFEHTPSSRYFNGVLVTSYDRVQVFRNTLRARDGAITSVADSSLAANLEHDGYPRASLQEAEPLGPPPEIVGVPAIGDEGADGEWTPGETVEVTVTFDHAVEVDTAGGTPTIGLQLSGSQPRSAAYLRGSGTAELVFGYTLVDADGSHSVMMVPRNSLVLNGGTIRKGGADAALGHEGSIKLGLPRQELEEPTAQSGGPTARFEGLPQSNDGVTAFSFELHFSEEPDGMSWKTVAGGLLEVSGADVTKARRLDPSKNQGWEVDVTPTHDGDVVITLPARACGEANAVCFGNGATPLSAAVTTTVPALPFEGSFAQVPPEHDGATAFELNFHLSVAAGLGWKTVRDALFEVTGGRIETAYRLVRGSDLGWTIRVAPTDVGAVTVTLKATTDCNTPPGVCTASGRKLAGGVNAVIHGPASLSVADAAVDENAANASLAFAVTLSRARHEATTVAYATSDGTATADVDYTETSGTLTFAAGETAKTVSVPVLNDALDEGSETVTLTLSNPAPSAYVHLDDAEATGTIDNSDPMPKAWLARFGRTVAEQVLDAVGSRLESGRAAGTEVRLAGERIGSSLSAADREALEEREAAARLEALSEWVRHEHGDEAGHRFRTRALSGRDLVLGSSFTLTGGSEESGYGALWGRAAVSSFDGREGELAVDGEVTSAMVGADFTRGPGTAGVLVSHSEGEGGYRSPDGSGEVSSTLTGLYPYGRWRASESLSFWGTAGYGAGTLTLEPAGRPSIEADMKLSMAGAGVRNELLTPREGEGASLALTTDGFVVRTTSERVAGELAAARAQVTQVRMGLEGSLEVPLGGGRLVPSLEIGVRHDGGDAETGFGADIGAGLAWSDPGSGVEAEVRARGLLTHEDASLRERGIAGSFSWDADPSSERGFSLTLRQSVGGPSSGGMHALFGRRTLAGLAANDDGDDLERRRLEATLGYGMGMFGDGFTGTPELGVVLSDTDREYRVGWRLGLVRREDVDFDLSLDATRHEPADDDREPSQRIGLGLNARW